MNLYDIVRKLTGPIDAAGESHLDEKRLENLKEITNLVSQLLGDITDSAGTANRQEHSMKQIGTHAAEFLEEIHAELDYWKDNRV